LPSSLRRKRRRILNASSVVAMTTEMVAIEEETGGALMRMIGVHPSLRTLASPLLQRQIVHLFSRTLALLPLPRQIVVPLATEICVATGMVIGTKDHRPCSKTLALLQLLGIMKRIELSGNKRGLSVAHRHRLPTHALQQQLLTMSVRMRRGCRSGLNAVEMIASVDVMMKGVQEVAALDVWKTTGVQEEIALGAGMIGDPLLCRIHALQLQFRVMMIMYLLKSGIRETVKDRRKEEADLVIVRTEAAGSVTVRMAVAGLETVMVEMAVDALEVEGVATVMTVGGVEEDMVAATTVRWSSPLALDGSKKLNLNQLKNSHLLAEIKRLLIFLHPRNARRRWYCLLWRLQ
jgi:hypothetical protein